MSDLALADVSSPDVSRLAGGAAVLPIGAVEQHGAHLPITTDTHLTQAFADTAAARCRDLPIWLLPQVVYGKSTEHLGFPGTVTLSASTLTAVVADVARSVRAAGITRLLLLTAHGGNPEVLGLLTRDLRADLGMTVRSVHAPSLPVGDLASGPDAGWDVHGGHYETSVMLALFPHLVRMDLAVADGRGFQELVRADPSAAASWFTEDLSTSGIIGDPTSADAGWGRAAFEHQADGVARILRGLCEEER